MICNRRTTSTDLRSTLSLSCAVAVASASALLGACGSESSTAGVAAVASGRSDADQRIVVSLPDDFVLGPGAARSVTGESTVSLPEVPVETLVEPPAPLPDDVVVIGDSLTLSAEEEIETSLRSLGLDVLAIDAVESRRMANGGSRLPPGVDAIAEVLEAGAEPGLWVIALGTNDVGSGGNVDGFRASVRDVLALIPESAPVVWVDVWIGGRQEASAEANEAIRAELRAWEGGAAVVDWYARGAADDGSITGDGVHLTESGRTAFADAIVEAIVSLYR